MYVFKRCFAPRRRRLHMVVSALLLALLKTSASYNHGDVVSMTHRTSQLTRRAEESQETAWEEALRSQMPRFGRPDTIRFTPSLPADGVTDSPAVEEELAVAFAFSEEQFVLRRVTLRDGGGGGERGGPRLSRLVVAFTRSAGDIVRVRSDPVYGDSEGGGGDVAPGIEGFEVEYRWERLPEEDEPAGVWLVFAVSLLLTVFLAVDTCNSTADGGHDGNAWDDHDHVGGPPPQPSSSSSSSPSSLARTGGYVEEWARSGGGEERIRRR